MRVQGISVYEAAGAVYYSKGPHKDKLANVHRCCSCQKWTEPIFKGVAGDAETYLYEECVDCGEVICAECRIEVGEPGDEVTGVTENDEVTGINEGSDDAVCGDCWQTRCIRKAQ